ncbi:MAG: hypothetical protein HYY14_05815 [Candidatus Omnitrophica bacterium]|nr:hypothetical protein [Candidatus Omnitrophota bacterium]
MLDLLWLLGAVVVYGAPLKLALAAGALLASHGPRVWAPALGCLAGFFVFLVSLILVVGVFRLILPSVPTGTYPMRSVKALRFYLQHGLKGYISSTFLIRVIHHLSIFRTLYYWVMGAKYSPSAFVGLDAELHDPSLIEVGDRVFIGEGAHIYGHMVMDGRLHVAKVRIGPKAMVGAHTLVGPGVEMGEGAQVAACSAVPAGTRIGPGELWLGSPAKKVKRLGGIRGQVLQ